MSLTSWGEWNESAAVHELHGELVIRLPTPWTENLFFGFCFGLDDGVKWDCLVAFAGINADKIRREPGYASSFMVRDGSTYGAVLSHPRDLKPDPQKAKVDPTYNWFPVVSDSSKKCSKEGES